MLRMNNVTKQHDFVRDTIRKKNPPRRKAINKSCRMSNH